MIERHEVVVIGGGQAGLSMSYYLKQAGVNHIVLERGTGVGETWRTRRWDSFTLVTPNWTVQLPGHPYNGGDPDGFMKRDEVVAYLEEYSESFGLPVRCGVQVDSLDRSPSGRRYIIQADDSIYEADSVVVAAGAFPVPKIPAMSSRVPHALLQIHTDQYKNPRLLPAGAVLVVGTGQSGCQIAEELLKSGHKVYLTTSSCGRVPRRYRGKDIIWWMDRIGTLDDLVDDLPSPQAKFRCNPHLSGKDGGHEINLRKLARDGLVLLGHLQGIDDGKLILASDLDQNLRQADEFASDLLKKIDDYVRCVGLELPLEESLTEVPPGNGSDVSEEPILSLDLDASEINTIIWAGGYKVAFEWIHLPVFDETGYPIHRRGVTSSPGLYFLGLNWLYKRKSCLLIGVGEDAEHIASIIQSNQSERQISAMP